MKKVYLDYAATTFVSDNVLHEFINSCKYIGNPNSLHLLGNDCFNKINNDTEEIKKLLNIFDSEIIYTSGSSESNNLAIKGVCMNYSKGHIITTNFEHSSIISTLNYLSNMNFDIDFLETNNGIVDINEIDKLIRNDTILITMASVSSELGLLQPINEIANFLKEKYPHIVFHVDMTQSIGKVNINMNNIDLISLSGHKIYGIKGSGLLIRKNNIKLIPLIHGGKSTSIYRSGTPQLELISSLKIAIKDSINDIDLKYKYVLNLNNKIKDFLNKYQDIYINSNKYCIPHILNFSIIGIDSLEFQKLMSNNGIYLSTRTACSTSNYSLAVFSLTKDQKRSKSSIRISLSHLTTDDEIEYFFLIFDKVYKELKYGSCCN